MEDLIPYSRTDRIAPIALVMANTPLSDWCDTVAQVQESLEELREEGLSGYFYTQLTDIQEETNGLITYDRAVVKGENVLIS